MPCLAAISFLVLQVRSPLEFAQRELKEALGQTATRVDLKIQAGLPKEGYRITPSGPRVSIAGADANGLMYGALEFAERVKRQGQSAWTQAASGKPFLADRGLNLFLTLPWDYKKNDTDNDPAALIDPKRWWFQNDDYWTTLLDLMARSRLNWLDLHGAWDISVTNAPNLYAYFVTSPTFPLVGVSEAIKKANLDRLNWVVDMAHARGIRVSLMAYEANLRIPQNPKPPYQATEANIYTYTKEVVEQMVRRVPKLDAIGFRIGESGRSESFFKCYGEAIKNSGHEIPLITRSWITRKQRVLPLARASKDFTVEIKYNGEQWGAPYMVAGGRMANWYSYSFEDYLSDSGSDRAAKMWPGNDAAGGGKWPSEPYKIVWQVRANGTHRIFPFYNPDWVRRTINEMKIGTASGYTIEGEDAYYPKSPDYYLANPNDKYCDWIHQRDEMYWMTWGRLGYDPTTPDSVFDARVADWFGKQYPEEQDIWKRASLTVPLTFMAHALGPDHRDHAPELETGGTIEDFISIDPFDSFAVRPIREDAWALALGLPSDGRLRGSKLVGLQYPFEIDYGIRPELPVPTTNRWRELVSSVKSLDSLLSYHWGRLATAELVAEGDGRAELRQLQESNFEIDRWRQIDRGFYRPLTERLRMHTNTFAWKDQLPALEREARAGVTARAGMVRPPSERVQDVSIGWKSVGRNVEVSFSDYNATSAYLLSKPLPSSTFFHRSPMAKDGDRWVAKFSRERHGYCIAAEVHQGENAFRIPNITKGKAPYLIVPAQAGPTPQFYNAEEALAYLDPEKITPDKYSAIFIGSRANDFFRRFDRRMQRKLLSPVAKGLKLVIAQEDWLAGRYTLDFLPKPIQAQNIAKHDEFIANGALGIPDVKTHDILYQRFLASNDWQVFGNGGIAKLSFGNGEIWLINARLIQRMTHPDAAKALKAMLEVGGRTLPTILVDTGTEGAIYTTAVYPDCMNALGVPFATLGEAIAKEQGMDSFKVIPGPTAADDLLNGKGSTLANAFLKKQVQTWAKRPTPSKESFEQVRAERKKALMRTLGLDPLPPRTPLNARTTGSIQRDGYRIEKLVYESRPGFFVTAHLYVPAVRGKHPVIVNVNGHWAHKKGEDRLQLRSALQALNGYMALTIDSPGWSFEGNNLIERRGEGTHHDPFVVQGGTNTTGYYVWDAMRGLDYMATRADADMTRVGITGASGGGLATLYTFAADDRYKAAVPVVYMASMETQPDNGCLCNHVPATSQIGDRSDIIAIQAPKPVYIMSATNDGEFPPDAQRLTHKKMQQTWALFGKSDDVFVQVYAGGHDYNQPMRETMIGFFDKYLKGVGTGAPVKEPPITLFDPEDRSQLVLDPAPKERTMRDLALDALKSAPSEISAADAIAVNGGIPEKTALNLKSWESDGRRYMTFESEPGLFTPAIQVGSKLRIIIDDAGKATAVAKGESGIYLDILGVGELGGIEVRYPIYLGRSIAFMGGWQIVRLIDALNARGRDVEIVANGPISTQAVMWAGLMDPTIGKITAQGGLERWEDVFKPGVSEYAVQPRANYCGSLAHLRSLVKNATWK